MINADDGSVFFCILYMVGLATCLSALYYIHRLTNSIRSPWPEAMYTAHNFFVACAGFAVCPILNLAVGLVTWYFLLTTPELTKDARK